MDMDRNGEDSALDSMEMRFLFIADFPHEIGVFRHFEV